MMDVDARLSAALSTRYHLERELGRGGTATVYLANDLRHPRQVAVKVLRPEFVLRGSVERFLREIDIAAHLQHPHILPLLDSGEADGFLFFVMPFVDGETLRERIRREGKLALPDILRILSDVVDAVAHAHARGVMHRDIKPENILLAGRHALVTDFGVARALSQLGGSEGLTQGVALGTPTYMAPEQATADPKVDHRVDIYALGVLIYELLAGRPPFSGATAQDILTAHVVLTPEPVTSHRADAPSGLVAIINRCLAKRPDERYQDAMALLTDLDPLVTPSGGMTPAGTAPVRLPRRASRLAGGALAALALVAAAWALRPRSPPAGSTMLRQLTFRGDVLEVSLSPDGEFLAYVADHGGKEQLYVHDLRAGTPLMLAEGARLVRPSWSADGSEIRFFWTRDSVDESAAVPRLGGPTRRLPRTGWLSPDGRQTAAIPSAGGRLRIYGLERGDSTIVMLPVGERIAAGLSWSPDSRLISVRTLALANENASFFVAEVASGTGREVLRDSTMLTESVWTRDGSALLYLRRWGGVVSLWRLRLGPNGAPRGGPEMLATGLPEPDFTGLLTTRPSLSSDGKRLLYKVVETRSNLARISLTGPASGMGLHPLTTGTATHPYARISEDGRTVALVRREGDGAIVGTMPLAGGTPEIVGRLQRANEVAWSPEGDAIAVAGQLPGDTLAGIHVFSLRGERTRTFLRGKVSSGIEWLRDGRVLYTRYGQTKFGILNPRTGADTTVTFADTMGWVFWPRASRDAKRLLFAWNRLDGHAPLYLASPEGGATRRVIGDGWAPLRQMPGDSAFYGVRRTSSEDAVEVVVLPLDGRPPRPLLGLPPGIRALDVSPDGRTLLLAARQHQSDVWEVTLPAR